MAANPKKKLAQTMAERADIHELYEQSVQAVDLETEFLQDTFRSLRGRKDISHCERERGDRARARAAAGSRMSR